MSHRSRPKPSKAPLADGSVLLVCIIFSFDRTAFLTAIQWIQEHQAKQKAADHIPGLTQKILWKSDLTPIDLLQLPIVPKGFMHRLTYINVAVEVGEENVTRGHSPNSNISKPIKLFKSGIEFTASMQPRSYIGSSIDAKGSYMRVVTHERQLHCQRKGEFGSMHYDFGSQAGVVPNFRLVGVWTNPRLLSNDEDTFQDIER